MIRIRRVYEPPGPGDGARFLVARLWARGVRRAVLRLDGWLTDVAPSDGLRRSFGHNPRRRTEVRSRYRAELTAHPDAWRPLRRGRTARPRDPARRRAGPAATVRSS
jgi:uncharacterized protein YeaO (DUF488 family)